MILPVICMNALLGAWIFLVLAMEVNQSNRRKVPKGNECKYKIFFMNCYSFEMYTSRFLLRKKYNTQLFSSRLSEPPENVKKDKKALTRFWNKECAVRYRKRIQDSVLGPL